MVTRVSRVHTSSIYIYCIQRTVQWNLPKPVVLQEFLARPFYYILHVQTNTHYLGMYYIHIVAQSVNHMIIMISAERIQVLLVKWSEWSSMYAHTVC